MFNKIHYFLRTQRNAQPINDWANFTPVFVPRTQVGGSRKQGVLLYPADAMRQQVHSADLRNILVCRSILCTIIILFSV